MKGIVFTSFLDLVELKYDYNMVDRILVACDLPSGGVYTTVGTYDSSEMIKLVNALSAETDVPVASILYKVGIHLFPKLYTSYGHLFSGIHDVFDLLIQLDSHIHVEVTKLYPDAELPRFETRVIDENSIEMIYRSQRKLADYAHGLIQGALDYFADKATVSRENLTEDNTVVRFLVQKV